MLSFIPRSRLVSLLALLFGAFVLATANPAGAQGSALGTAEDSPIAVPFLGDYEVWCTDRNPAPGNRCSSHHGSPAIDLGMDPGTPLYAAGSGTVIEADGFCGTRGWCNNGKGNSVVIEHADGTFSRYLHMAAVSVEKDQIVNVGDPIGTSGESGQSSSPHLHYDEHFPRGTRTPMGQWVGCVNGQEVRYPDVFGTSDWNEVPYGSRVVNDSFDCLDGVDVSSTAQPRVLPGTTHFAVTPPSSTSSDRFEISIDVNDGSGPVVTSLRGTALIYLPAPAASATIAVRQKVLGEWRAWSIPLIYTPGLVSGSTCYGLAATTTSLEGSADVDVIIGTSGDDRIVSRGGDDVICAGAGDDVIVAGQGKDVIFGGAGNDTIHGGKGADTIWAQAGRDKARGDKGADILRGGKDADTLLGGSGNDVLLGGNGTDTLNGGNGLDSYDGGSGTDTCVPDAELLNDHVRCEQ